MAQVSSANPMLPPLPATPTSPSSISTRGGLASHHISGPITRQQQRQLQLQQQQQQYHHNSASITSTLSSATSSTSIASRVSSSHQFKTATPPGSPAVPNFSASRKLYRDPPTLPPLPSSSPILTDTTADTSITTTTATTTTTNSHATVPAGITCSPLSIESSPATPLTGNSISSISSISNSSIGTNTATTTVYTGYNSSSSSSSGGGGGGTQHVTTPLRLKFESALANSPTYQPAQHRYRRLSASAPIKEPQLRPAAPIDSTPSVSRLPSSSRNYKSLAISTATTSGAQAQAQTPSTRQTSTASTTSIISTASSSSTANSSITEVTVPPLSHSHFSQMDVRHQTPPLSIKKPSNASTPASSSAPTPQGTSPLQSNNTVPKLLTLTKALSNTNGISPLSNLVVGPAKYFEESNVQHRLALLVQSPQRFWEIVDLGFPTDINDGRLEAPETPTDNGVFDDSQDEEHEFSNSTVEEHLPSWQHRSMSQGTSNSNDGSSGNIFRKAQPEKYRAPGRSRPEYSLRALSVEREMTLKFTLTPSTMRADETLIYGWQKEYVESGTLKNYKRTIEEDPDVTEDAHNTGLAGGAAAVSSQPSGFIPSRGLGDNGGKVKGLFSRLRKPKETKNAYMITSSDV